RVSVRRRHGRHARGAAHVRAGVASGVSGVIRDHASGCRGQRATAGPQPPRSRRRRGHSLVWRFPSFDFVVVPRPRTGAPAGRAKGTLWGMSPRIRVGTVGATVTRGGSGWGANAHIPALRALPDYELKAVCTAHADTARASQEAFGAELAFDN